MVKGYSRRIQYSLFFLFVSFVFSLNSHAQPKPEFIHSLWVAQEHNLLKISSATGQLLFQIPVIEETQAIAVDKSRGVVWLVDGSNVFAYDFTGVLQHQFPLPVPVGVNDLDDINLVVNEEDGSLWLSKGDAIWHLTSSGQTLLSLQLSGQIETFILNPSNQQLWIASNNTVHVFQQIDGLLLQKITVNSEVEVLAYDAGLKEVWLASEVNLFRYTTSGIATYQQSFPNIEDIEPDGKGQVWIAANNDLFYRDVSGAVLFQLTPFSGEINPEIESIRLDPSDQTAWVAGEVGLVQVDSQGLIKQRIQLNSETEELALYSDIIAPLLSFEHPTQSSYSNTATPTLSLQYSDNGIGTDTSTLKIEEVGINLPVTCQHLTNTSTCVPNSPLIEGLHSLDATVKDHSGNTSQKASTSFTVDTIAPAITVNSHWNGAYVNQSAQALSGSLSEFATLDINGLPITLGLNNIFAYPVLLFEGQNNFLFTAKDQATNVGSFPFVLFLDTVLPAAVNVDSVTVSDSINGESTLTGQAGSVEADAIVEVTNLTTNVVTTVQANADGSFSLVVQANPNDTLNIVVIDKAGNRSELSVINLKPLLSISITSPVDLNTVQSDFINIEGAFKGPVNSGITINGHSAEVSPEGKFIFNSLGLNNGSNTIEILLTTLSGDTAKKIFTVISEGQSLPLKFEPNFNSGPAPFDVDLEFAWYSNEPVLKIEVDYEGDGIIDYTINLEQESFTTTYTLPGIYRPSITVTTAVASYKKQTVILVQSRESMIQLFTSIWDGMNKALVQSDLNTALTYLDSFGESQYAPVFEALKDKMPQIVQSYSIPQAVLITGSVGELAVNRLYQGQNRIYFVYFMRDKDGVWKLHNM